jgi:hypothetical protein
MANKINDPILSGLFQNSVTAGDEATSGAPGIFNFIVPVYGGAYIISQLPAEAPPYTPNNKQRDTLLSITPHIEGLWGDALDISISKMISRGYEFNGPDAQVKRVYDMFDNCDNGNGFHKFLARHLRDYKTTDNGAWVELVRETDNPGAPVVSFNHLDSLRCWRTGDPQTPIYYYDLQGRYHELKWWQCFNVVDMSSPRAGSYNSGLCAAARAYREIRKLTAMSIYVDEKLTGNGATEIEFVQGVHGKQIEDALKVAEDDESSKGIIYYKGKVIIPVLSDLTLSGRTVNLKGMPDGFDRDKEFRIAALVYTKSLGLVPTDLDPSLTARGSLGVGKAEEIQFENARGFGDGDWEKQFTSELNRLIIPSRTTFAISSRNLRDEQEEANVMKARADAYKVMADAGFIDADQGKQLLVDAGDLPEQFLPPPGDTTPENTVTDQEQVDAQLDVSSESADQIEALEPVEPAVKERNDLLALKASIDATRVEIAAARRENKPWYRKGW